MKLLEPNVTLGRRSIRHALRAPPVSLAVLRLVLATRHGTGFAIG
jgi:hypothetical protein